jgi:hypothetical protein
MLSIDKEKLEGLIADQPKEIRGKGVLLFNGAASCAQQYQTAPTAANLRDWEAAQAALEKFCAQLEGAAADGAGDKPLPNLAAALDYLKASDWSVTRTSLYRHHKEGKLSPRSDGQYALRDIEKYARTWLKQKSTGKRVGEKIEELHRRKLELELLNLDLENKRRVLAYDRDLDKYVPKELMEIELATRAGVLDAGLKHWVQSRAAEWIRAAGGDTKKVGDVINLMTHDLEEHINSYARSSEYLVVIDAEEEVDPEPETETENGEEEQPEC